MRALDIPALTVILPVRELPASAPEQRHPEGSESNGQGRGPQRRPKPPAMQIPALPVAPTLPSTSDLVPDGHIDIRA